jgi:ATP-binding cassette subfamily B protein
MVCLHYRKETTITKLRDMMGTDILGTNLIGLARAFLKANDFYILDESTSNLDFGTEGIIFDMIYNKFKGKTMLIVAHRLSTVKHCDSIVVLDKGKVMEQGSHGELMAKGGMYRRLWEMQQGNFVAAEEMRGGGQAEEPAAPSEADGDEMRYT